MGLSPANLNDVINTYTPKSKLIIRSGPVTASGLIQRQIQFRYGGTIAQPDGDFAGSLLADTKNLFLGGNYRELFNVSGGVNNSAYPTNNLAIGYQALNYITIGPTSKKVAKNNTAVGTNALANLSYGYNNTAIGSHAGEGTTSHYNNVYVGSYAGYTATGYNNTLIGYESNTGSANNNIYVGASTGKLSNDYENWGSASTGSNNIAIGYKALNNITSGNYNTAIGSGALVNLTEGSYNTAIGYNACSNLTTESYKTCIGYNSGPTNNSVKVDLGLYPDDSVQRTYIGSRPKGNFGGDAVLEIHNSNFTNNGLANNPFVKSNTTTIINGNLLVRGNTFFTVGSYLYPFYFHETSQLFGTEIDKPCIKNQFKYAYDDSLPNCSPLSHPFYASSSDRRLKNIGTRFKDGLDKINQLNVYNYTFKNDKSKSPHVGVIAQELQKVFPNSISTDENGYLQIRWDEMFYAALNSLKELNHKIVNALRDITNLEKKITKMEKENEQLKSQIENLSSRIEKLKLQQNH